MRSSRTDALSAVFLLVFALAPGCGDDGSATGGGGSESGGANEGGTALGGGTNQGGANTSGGGGEGGQTPVTDDFTAGGDRPVLVKVPSNYDPAVPAPLLILLHGYSASGTLQNTYFGLEPVADERGIVYAYPDGTKDAQGNGFWNATDACCDFAATGVDDEGYLLGLIDEIASKVTIDPKRIYFVGHSNGGFMSYRLACAAGSRIAAIVSLAGATFADPADCGAESAPSVLQVHGDNDETVPYAGGALAGTTIPSALESVSYFASVAGCDPTPMTAGAPLDLVSSLAGQETTVEAFGGCDAGYGFELWTIQGGSHVPAFTDAWAPTIVDFLLAHPKP